MSQAAQLTFAQSSTGRCVLHVLCWMKDGKHRWHLAGIGRELKAQLMPRKSLATIVSDRATLRLIILTAIILSQCV